MSKRLGQAEQMRAVLSAQDEVIESFSILAPRIRHRIVNHMHNAPIGSMSPAECGQVSAFTDALSTLSLALQNAGESA